MVGEVEVEPSFVSSVRWSLEVAQVYGCCPVPDVLDVYGVPISTVQSQTDAPTPR